mmetsp:Transcript_11084/g.16324  ORF Transcript_11084/g.16324 Transcript_11084/m.16324 type:complete len:181 (+) Transcript_11084:1058-1600(+)
MERPQCPSVILDDIGGAFAMGLIGGGAWNFAKGLRFAPKGERYQTALRSMCKRGPIAGGNFAAWGGLFATFDCALRKVRGKEDLWNSVIAGGAAGGILQIRGGVGRFVTGAIFGAAFLLLLEGAQIIMTRSMTNMQTTMMEKSQTFVPDSPQWDKSGPIYNVLDVDREFDWEPRYGTQTL